jgi:YidC/Oxa1 family membrane protein insertase
VTILTFLYSILGENVVLAIVVFTILIRIAILPLTAQQQRSAKAMQKLQPKLKELQEKHKNDREKLAQEQMALYREYGVNPFGGCLPLLIQLPILISLYQAIIFALAATPFQLVDLAGRMPAGLDQLVPLNNMWLGMDLTKPPTANPTFALALPALVLVTTWLQSKVTIPPPTTTPSADGKPDQAAAMQQSMTTIMPLMFGFFSLSFSVGLSIYFITGNIVGIIQYSLMNDTSQLRKWLNRGKTAEEPVVVDVKPRPMNNGRKSSEVKDAKPQPKTKTKATKTKAGRAN